MKLTKTIYLGRVIISFIVLILVFALVLIYFSSSKSPEWIGFTSGKFILSFAEEGDYLWIGTKGGGLVKLNKATGEFIVYDKWNSGLHSNDVISIVIDGKGNKWIGTSEGIARFDGVDWTIFRALNSDLISKRINTMAIDNQENIWIGTSDAGLIRFDGTNWIVYNTSNSGLPDNTVWAITIDNQGNKWIGTLGGGLAKFDGVNWTVYNRSNSGLPDNFILAIAIDEQGNKWIGTSEDLQSLMV
jgi:ligand-binding sensor domain-containing protein